MFWHDIVYIELLYCVTKFELVWTWNKVAGVENAQKVSTVPYLHLNKNIFLKITHRLEGDTAITNLKRDGNFAIGKPARQVRKPSHCGSKQQ